MGFPNWLSTFVGRDTERKVLSRLLDEQRLVTVVGPGGCGKTRLAARVALDRADERAADDRADEGGGDRVGEPVWFAPLGQLGDPDADPAAVAALVRDAVGAHEEAWRDPLDTLGDWLGSDPGVLVIDNAEHLAPACAAVVGALVARAPALTVLVTSRQPLGVDGELVWELPPLDAPDAVRLFVERAGLARPDLHLDDEQVGVAVELVERLDGLPLAIELAAARTAMMPVDQILAELDDRFHLLTRAHSGPVSRHQTLAASIDWSYDRLDPAEQVLLRRLSVFAGGWSLDAARRVAADAPLAPSQVVDLLGRLVARSLVQVDHAGQLDRSGRVEARYRLLESIQAYGRDRLTDAGERDRVLDAHLGWAAELVAEAEAELDSRHQARWLDRLDPEHANLAAALAHARGHQHDTALAMAAGLSLFWKLRGHFGEARRTLLALLDDPATRPGAQARAARWALADLSYWMGDLDGAIGQAEAVLAQARAASDDVVERRARWTLGMARSLGDLDQARLDGLAAIDLAVAAGDHWLEGVARQVVGVAARFQGDTAEARHQLQAALELSQVHDVPQLLACSWAMVQFLEVDAGRLAEADRCFEAGMAAAIEILDPATPGYLADAQAEALHLRGRTDEARDLLEVAIAELYASGTRTYEPFLHHRLALVLMGVDDQAATAEIDRILDLPEPAPAHPVYALFARAWLEVSTGADQARTTADDALSLARLIGPRTTVEHLVVAGLARLPRHPGPSDPGAGDPGAGDPIVGDRGAGDPGAAAEPLLEALGLAQEAGLAPWIPEALDGLAASWAEQDRDLDAARLWGAADRARAELGTVRLAVTDRVIGAIEAASAQRLGPDHAVARAAGAELTPAQAVVHARRNRGRRRRPAVGWESLTPAEQQVVDLAAEGLTNPQIAARLFVSAGTVKTHLAHAYTKLGVTNRTELARGKARQST